MAPRNDLAENLADENVERRLRAGIVTLFAALLFAVVFDRMQVPLPVRLALFFPFFFAANSFFQGMYKTCGFSAWAGCRHDGRTQERIADPEELRAVQRRGRKQVLLAACAALVLTLSFVAAA